MFAREIKIIDAINMVTVHYVTLTMYVLPKLCIVVIDYNTTMVPTYKLVRSYDANEAKRLKEELDFKRDRPSDVRCMTGLGPVVDIRVVLTCKEFGQLNSKND